MPGDIIDTAIKELRKRLEHVSVQIVGILNTFYEQTYANYLHLRVFLVQWHLPKMSGIYCVYAWW